MPGGGRRAKAGGGIALRIEIDHQRLVSGRGQRGGQVDRRRRLAHAPLLIRDRDDPLDHGGDRGRMFLTTRVVPESVGCDSASNDQSSSAFDRSTPTCRPLGKMQTVAGC